MTMSVKMASSQPNFIHVGILSSWGEEGEAEESVSEGSVSDGSVLERSCGEESVESCTVLAGGGRVVVVVERRVLLVVGGGGLEDWRGLEGCGRVPCERVSYTCEEVDGAMASSCLAGSGGSAGSVSADFAVSCVFSPVMVVRASATFFRVRLDRLLSLFLTCDSYSDICGVIDDTSPPSTSFSSSPSSLERMGLEAPLVD